MVGQVIGAQGMAGLVQHRQLIWMEIGGAPREGDGLPEVAGSLSGLGMAAVSSRAVYSEDGAVWVQRATTEAAPGRST